MTPSGAKTIELAELLTLMCDGEIGRVESERIEALLLDDPEAQEFYRRYISLDVELAWRAAGRKAEGENAKCKLQMANCKLPESSPQPPAPSPSSIPPSAISLPPSVSLFSFLPTTPLGNVAFSYAMSALLVAIGLFIFSLMSASSPRNTVVNNKPTDIQNRTTSNVPTPEPEIVSIARITGMIDCVWVDTDDAPFHDRVVLGTKYMLKSGLMEITYYTGAKVILQGPCTYTAESTAGGYLSLGKLTARVESRSRLPDGTSGTSKFRLPDRTLPTDHGIAKSRPAGGTYFAVRTPTAIVTDLGTEFGVEVDKSGATQSRVYCGRVEVRVVGGKTKAGDQIIPLGENESVRVTLDKTKAIKVIRDTSTDPSSSFVRGMPRRVPIKLFNTGVGLKPGDADLHWQLVARSDNIKFKPAPAVVSGTNGHWMGNDPPRSQWISAVGDCSNVPDGVVYTFRTTFQLREAYLGTAVLRGMFAVDNHVRAIRLNGHEVPVPEHGYDDSFCIFHPFPHRGGFVEGVNVLEFEVQNGGSSVQYHVSSMGLRVELEGSVIPRRETSANQQQTETKN